MSFTEVELRYIDKLLFQHLIEITDNIMSSDDKIQETDKSKFVLHLNCGCHEKIQKLLKDIDK